MVNFDLSPEHQAVRLAAKTFATTHLKGARAIYEAASSSPKWEDRFRSTLPLYQEAVKSGLVKAQVPVPLGGTGGTLMGSLLVTEELYAVDTSVSLTILGTGLGLTPLLLAGNPKQHETLLKPFLTQTGAPLASLAFSEPGGSANYAAPGASGLTTTATLENGEYTIDGEKIWATNCSGWDDRGADIQCVVCRIVDPENRSEALDRARNETAIIIVTKEDILANKPDAFTVVIHPQTVGHTAVNGPHVCYKGLRVPQSNLLAAPGKGAEIVEMTFTASAAIVGAMGVGIMRQTFERALSWAKAEKRGSTEAMIEKQSVADLLVKIKTRCEASRMLSWKACHALGQTPFSAEIAYEAKIFGSESAVESVLDAINLMGVCVFIDYFIPLIS
jgi:nitroalkane oxidase